MKWELLNNSDGRHSLSIKADWSEIVADYNDLVVEYKRVRIPGFRPGKTPIAVIEKRFQREIMGDLFQRVAQRFSRQAVKEASLEVLGPAEMEEIACSKNETFLVNLHFYPLPVIELPDIKSLGTSDNNIDYRDHLSLKLLDMVSLEIPDSLVGDELALSGLDPTAMESEDWKAARDRIKLVLILQQIARQEGIEVDGTDLDNRILEKAEELGKTETALRAELDSEGAMLRLKEMLLAERTLEYLMEINM